MVENLYSNLKEDQAPVQLPKFASILLYISLLQLVVGQVFTFLKLVDLLKNALMLRPMVSLKMI
jgi:hypothetical protein